MTRKTNATDAVLKELREFGLAYPGAHTKSPWPGHLDLAVKDKTFAYMSLEGEPLAISCKLPHSSSVALMLPFTKPTAYGLGKSGWVSANFEGRVPPVEMIKAWIDESYRAQAPKKLVASLGEAPGAPAAPKKGAPKTEAAVAKKTPAQKAKVSKAKKTSRAKPKR
jgi:predicted DNA-binding protein (MmcQ/YjbR family)